MTDTVKDTVKEKKPAERIAELEEKVVELTERLDELVEEVEEFKFKVRRGFRI